MWVPLSVYRGEGKGLQPSPRRCQPSEVQAHPAFHPASGTASVLGGKQKVWRPESQIKAGFQKELGTLSNMIDN